MDTLPSAARCALHAEVPATFVCSRCGAFGCEGCRAGPERCAACAAREGPPPPVFAEVLNDAIRAIRFAWGKVVTLAAVMAIPGVAMGLALIAPNRELLAFAKRRPPAPPRELFEHMLGLLPPFGIGIVGNIVFFTLVVGALCHAYRDALDGRERPLAAQWAQSLRTMPALLVAFLLQSLLITLGGVLCCIPGLLALTVTSVAVPIVALEGLGPLRAIEASRARARRHIPLVAGVMLISYTLVIAVSMGASFARPILSELGTGGEVVAAILTAAFGAVGGAAQYAFVVALHRRLPAS